VWRWWICAIGAEIAAIIQEEAFDYLDAPVQRVAGLEVPLPYALNLSQASKPGAQDLKNAIYRALEGGKRWQK
jgi:pyruvate dehydrogenase E1 component beta subunit